MKTHNLKCWPEFYTVIRDKTKQFEIRRNDRDFKVGDQLRLQEWNPKTEKYTGNCVSAIIHYMTDFEQKPGFVVLGL